MPTAARVPLLDDLSEYLRQTPDGDAAEMNESLQRFFDNGGASPYRSPYRQRSAAGRS